MKRHIPVLLLISIVALAYPAFSQVETYKFTHTYYTTDSVQLKCAYYVPRSYDSTKLYPFFYAWHGAGMPAKDMRDVVVKTIATEIDAIVAAPDFNNVTTNAHLNFLLDTTLNFIQGTYSLDPAKSILTGYSAGGRIVFSLGLYYPDKWTGIIGMAPAFANQDMDDTMWANIGKIRMATILGDQDFNFVYVDALMTDFKNQNANLLYLIKPGVAHSDPYYTSQEFKDDYMQCYNYILNTTPVERIPEAAALDMHIYPQPVTASATMNYTIDATGYVSIRILDALGRQISEASEGLQTRGAHCIPIGANLLPPSLPTGVYTVVLQRGERLTTQKIFLIR